MDKILSSFKARSFSDKIALLALIVSILSYVFPISPSLKPTAFCPALLPQTTLKEWERIGDVPDDAIGRYIDEFDQLRGASGGFVENDILPRGVFIITAFGDQGGTLIYQSYPVKPVVHYNSIGVFQTTKVFKVTFPGACMTLKNFPTSFYLTFPVFLIAVSVLSFTIPRMQLFRKLFPTINKKES